MVELKPDMIPVIKRIIADALKLVQKYYPHYNELEIERFATDTLSKIIDIICK